MVASFFLQKYSLKVLFMKVIHIIKIISADIYAT